MTNWLGLNWCASEERSANLSQCEKLSVICLVPWFGWVENNPTENAKDSCNITGGNPKPHPGGVWAICKQPLTQVTLTLPRTWVLVLKTVLVLKLLNMPKLNAKFNLFLCRVTWSQTRTRSVSLLINIFYYNLQIIDEQNMHEPYPHMHSILWI